MEPAIEYLDPEEQNQQQQKQLSLSTSFSSLLIIPYKNYLPVPQASPLIDTISNIAAIRRYLDH